ncbi:uncharacterized protein LOC103959145 isoform X1 [Pyrus x bretschneideri]|uniref:uncharacterized protein LOC103959145 isoform X1 n=2 Tax=Pyrus x bretschneideri TaxID=225117 RepID=UPI00202E728C|nr:uncharacterized protein LOC103959145 isoform X1 [Pyrus x bretschneideri]
MQKVDIFFQKFLSLEISSQGFLAMGRGRGKAKKQNVIAAREDTGSGEEERILPSRRRGRPQKTLKDDIVEGEEALKTEDGEDAKSHVSSKDMKGQSAIENGRKRKRSAQVKETVKSVKEDKMIETKSSLDDPKKSVGFRQNGSRRKNKPHRAAEAGVECQ